MSSNIKVLRICNYCKKEFTAKTTKTVYCSHKCNSADYKLKLKGLKVEKSNEETRLIKTRDLDQIRAKEFLTVRDAAILLNTSIRTVYRLIDQGKIKAAQITERKTIILRSDIDSLFNQDKEPAEADQHREQIPNPKVYKRNELPNAGRIDINGFYSLKEIKDKYGISETAIIDLIIVNRIPKIKAGWFDYVPKGAIDNLLK